MSDNPDRVSFGKFLIACAENEMGPIRRYVSDQGDDIDAAYGIGYTGLHGAATNGHVEVCRFLVENGADTGKRSNYGETALDLALKHNYPMVVAVLDPAKAKELGEELLRAFHGCSLAHVISTRFKTAKGFEKFLAGCGLTFPDGHLEAGEPLDGEPTCDPNRMAALVKKVLQDRAPSPGHTMVFNPNFDNAYLMDGDSESANAIWLRNWLEVGLESARRTGGACVQVVTPPGLSEMQVAEATMAKAAGVRVVKLDCAQLFDYCGGAFQGGKERCEASLTATPAFAELAGAGASSARVYAWDSALLHHLCCLSCQNHSK